MYILYIYIYINYMSLYICVLCKCMYMCDECVRACACVTLDKLQPFSHNVFLELFENKIAFVVIVCKILNRKTMQFCI